MHIKLTSTVNRSHTTRTKDEQGQNDIQEDEHVYSYARRVERALASGFELHGDFMEAPGNVLNDRGSNGGLGGFNGAAGSEELCEMKVLQRSITDRREKVGHDRSSSLQLGVTW